MLNGKKRIRAVIIALVLALSLWSCSSPDEPWRADELLAVAVKNLDNEPANLSDYKGRIIMYNIWATWCEPCRKEIPDLMAIQDKYRDGGLVILGISLDQDPVDQVQRFVAAKEINYPVFYAGDQRDVITSKIHGFRGIPTTLLIDRDGRVVDKVVGAVPKREWLKRLKAYM